LVAPKRLQTIRSSPTPARPKDFGVITGCMKAAQVYRQKGAGNPA